MATSDEKAIMVAFGKRLQELRRERGMTQEQLADELDIHVTSIAFIETGVKFVRLSTLRKLALALKVELVDLFEGIAIR
jgi:transcriptional regulator with XRE-family HTH domain